ncbi:MAG TPA: PDZ domain-containing protein [Blastocatellia bacterium]|nr:PDZ domain-containing protein [Blastocatellia bacterium]HMV86348.1 PDZ domain-containing protein [Blastocatellia bacterium]HMY71474.1 PDZ domain-containing protein [Blastocatellia bacterium]HMZ17574.1 PDZ domain-containing protein [Blastocatellia bacterium]HNG31575.1 PDZ domain-containing protein [Blastocatellia bacterium]
MMKPTLSLLFALAWAGLCLAQSPNASDVTLFQKPTVNRTHIVFSYAGDLWIVPREGGDAKRLTTGVGVETDPRFSPDGTQIAFTGEYDGNVDVYTVPATGGVPKRLTHHPDADVVVGWTNDGKHVLFNSARNSATGWPQLFTVGLEGGLPEMLPLPLAERGAFSPDGTHIAYEPLAQWQPDWKRYKGGQADYLWIAKLLDSSIEKLPRETSNDKNPMWPTFGGGDKIYFLSDRNSPTGTVSLFAFDTKTKKVAQVVNNNGLDIKSASAGPDVIAYEQFGTIHLFDLKTGKAQKVNIRVAADLTLTRPRFEKVGNRIAIDLFSNRPMAAISPNGARAVFEARGDIISVPAEKGDPRNLTNTSGVMERSPAWSPDGKWIAYFSDESGEYELHLRDQKGNGEVKKIKPSNPQTFYYSLTWSPDSKKVAYFDKKLTLYTLDIEKGTPVKVDSNPVGFNNEVMNPSWSPDSRWIAYTKQLPNLLRAVFIYSLENNQTKQVTDGLSDARYAEFDRSGKYLYFTASTNIGPAVNFLDLSAIAHQPTRSVYAVVLRNDLPSPLAPESDEEKVAEEKKDGATGGQGEGAKPAEPKPADAAAAKPAPKGPEPVRIDFDGIDQRIVALPIPARAFADLQAGKANTIYLLEAPPVDVASFAPKRFTVHKFDLEKRKFDKALDGVGAFMVAAGGDKILYQQGFANWLIANAATLGSPLPPGAPGGPNLLKTSEMEAHVDPQAEWRQMFKEVWRGERDFFYDPNAHGLDLKAMEKLYEPYVKAVAHRSDLNYLFREMCNQLTIGHMFIGGGDTPDPKRVLGGLLGADYKIENGRYRFAKVFNGENWNPQLRAPLTQPGVNVKAGEYLLAVNGRELRATDEVFSFFESKAGKQVVLKVGPNADGTAAREVTVTPIANEQGLRNLDWIESNRRKVSELSGGKLAYVHLPDTANGGYINFTRYYFAQTNKEGAVIDERFNQGGYLADYIAETLNRKHLSNIYFREGGQDVMSPSGAIYGPKVMLVNELAGSGGDALPWYFRKLKTGTLVGKRTWGGLVASFPMPMLMDGGTVRAPDAAIYGTNGEWEVENVGVAPDVEVELDPAAWRQGRDLQLEKAVELLMEELKKNPSPKSKRPAFPVYQSVNPMAPAGQAAQTGKAGRQ